MLTAPKFLTFWGKARPQDVDGVPSHPVAYHLLDVAAAIDAILTARPITRHRAAELLRLPDHTAHELLVLLAALHDLGKFAPAFQAKAPNQWPDVLGTYDPAFAVRRHHTEDGMVLWSDVLADRLADRLWPGARATLDVLAPGVFGHHGRPVGAALFGESARQRFTGAGVNATDDCVDTLFALLWSAPIAAAPPPDRQTRIASWYISGLVTLADWLGSNERWFPYERVDADDPSLSRYWECARVRASAAVRESGLGAPSPHPLQPFADLTHVVDVPTPLQAWASSVALPDGPALVVIEDVTGAGKTEAAQMLVHRFMAAGRATGAYWAMPTMATANAMYARQSKMLDGLYAPSAHGMPPSLVLAHGQQRLHDGFRSTVIDGDQAAATPPSMSDELDSAVACTSFFADNRRAALLADVGAGTVDQALLAALPSRFNTVRLLGLADKVLVLDEVHAYDAYMSVEIQELLRFQAALGGTAVVLSATLPRCSRQSIVQAWVDGIGGGQRRSVIGVRTAPAMLQSTAYPLATVVAGGPAIGEQPLEPAPWSRRSVPVRLVHTSDEAIEHLVRVSHAGAASVWIRNTVDDCLAAAALLRARGLEPLVFHARFAQCDRQAREREVMQRFGKDAGGAVRSGRVLVATQVVEQSLDLDFDAMVSDIAPIDLIAQRTGRLWRHGTRTTAGQRPHDLAMEMVVLAPEPLADPPVDWLAGSFAGTAHVYANPAVLWRTVRVLAARQCIHTPDGLRDLIERVYGCEDLPPASLLAATQRAEGVKGAHSAAANYAVLKPPDGYHAGAVAWLSDMRVPTRLGDERTTIRLARVRDDGWIEPWASVDGPAWAAWALSEASVSRWRVPEDAMPDARYQDAITSVKRQWGRFEQEVPVLPLVNVGGDLWQGTLTRPDRAALLVEYTVASGLTFGASGGSQ